MLNKRLLILFLALFAGSVFLAGVESRTKEEMEDNLKLQDALIQLKQAQEERDRAQRDYQMNLAFYKDGIVTLKELNAAETTLQSAGLTFEKAQIGLEKTRLGFLANAARIEITRATKYLTEDGDRRVTITLRNSSDQAKALAADPSMSAEAVAGFLRVKQLRVVLESGSVIGDPYERLVPELAVGAEAGVDFSLLKDVPNLVVALSYGGKTDRQDVFLRKESLRDIPTIETSQGSQQGELGRVITYQIELERLAEDERRFNLIVVGLPRQYTANFKQNNATISNIKFNEKVSVNTVALEVMIPEKLDKSFVDRTVEFFVAVTKPSAAKTIADLNARAAEEKRAITADDLKGLADCNNLRLDFTPIGKGALEIAVENRFKEVKVGEQADFRVYVHNTGTLEMKNINVQITPPFEWDVTATPDFIESLKPDQREPVAIAAKPGSGAEIGEYDVRLKAVGEAGYEQITSDEKNFTVKLAPHAKLMQNLILVGVLVAVVVVISVVSVIVSRR
ncbi:MAG: NEW3 domain-containing protein [Planctomycetota bacterium]